MFAHYLHYSMAPAWLTESGIGSWNVGLCPQMQQGRNGRFYLLPVKPCIGFQPQENCLRYLDFIFFILVRLKFMIWRSQGISFHSLLFFFFSLFFFCNIQTFLEFLAKSRIKFLPAYFEKDSITHKSRTQKCAGEQAITPFFTVCDPVE